MNNQQTDFEKFLFFRANIIYTKYVYSSSFKKIDTG